MQPPPALPLPREEAVAEYLTATLPAAAAAAFMLESIVLHLLDSAAFLSGACLNSLRRGSSSGGCNGSGSAGASAAPSAQRPSSPVTRPGSAAGRPQAAVAAADGAVEVPLEGPRMPDGMPEADASACCHATPSKLREALEASAQANRVIMVAVVRRLLGEVSEGGGRGAEAESPLAALAVDHHQHHHDCTPGVHACARAVHHVLPDLGLHILP